MQPPVFAANWKMNHGPTEARDFVRAFLELHAPDPAATVILFPAAVSLEAVHCALAQRPDIAVGVQNVCTEDAGAFTGETSAPMARDAGAAYALVGHSERRHVFGEPDATTALKCAAVVRAGLTPMLCVGELLLERERGGTLDVVRRQLDAGLSQLTAEQIARMAIAYEPVWAIGTGRTATPADACEVHHALRVELAKYAGRAAERVPILYGGSVNPDNAPALLAAPNVDGLLVGGASLDPHTWARICGSRGRST
jgi:triosephosphate isomerase